MTVAQLIMRLQAFPQNAPVLRMQAEHGSNSLVDVDHVRYVPEAVEVVLE
jgi:hypothetical protein